MMESPLYTSSTLVLQIIFNSISYMFKKIDVYTSIVERAIHLINKMFIAKN
jgi:hypothetical protein